jgi:prepilin-type N-terminal cleavage/methylation domain-containing protein/prepilin-type processing-associated H-X9-DG protein
MNLKRTHRPGGLTLVELMIVIAVLAVLIALLLPALARPRFRVKRINFTNNLKQIGLSFRQWTLDNQDQFPMEASITNGGVRELAEQGLVWPVFQVLSNELNTPKILICPADRNRTNAPDFRRNLNPWELSYFVAMDATESQPQMILAGDSDLENNGAKFRPGLVELGTNRLVGWSTNRHNRQGNVALADGSVQSVTDSGLRKLLLGTGNPTNRILLP